MRYYVMQIDYENYGRLFRKALCFLDNLSTESIQRWVKKGYYKAVADINAETLEEVVEIGNIGPREKIDLVFGAKMYKISVGDIIVDRTDGNAYVVFPEGVATQLEIDYDID